MFKPSKKEKELIRSIRELEYALAVQERATKALEERVSQVERATSAIPYGPHLMRFNGGMYGFTRETISIRTLVQSILEHLNLDIESIPASSKGLKLIKRKKKKVNK